MRKTVDYLYNPYPEGTIEYDEHSSNLICVVNTTGTPYFQHQPLRDVVIWYGLSEGIRDGILKEVAGNIQAFDFEGNVEAYLAHVVEDFLRDYAGISLLDGTPAKLAIFFPQTDDVEGLRPVIEAKLAALGYPPTLLLEHHTNNEHKDDFDRFKSKDSPHRIALLVDRGVQGWNVPALFACALARRLKSSNNFVLQASSRCLRQTIAESEAIVASLRARVSELDARYTQLRAAARMQPELEAELTQLNRDYDIQKKQYESLVTRRESAAISGSMDATAGVADFRVIDPPIVGPKPVAPNRSLLLLGALAAALGAGIAASFLVSQIFPTVHDSRRLRELAGRPVLGTVTLLANPGVVRKRRRSTWLFAGGVASLVAVYGLAIGLVA